MLFSRSAAYAIRAMTFLAAQPAGKLAGAKAIARAEEIPMPFLWKILQVLTHRRLIRSFKGLHGGYELAQPAAQIPLTAIVQSLDPSDPTQRCALGLGKCSEDSTCALHDFWKNLRAGMTDLLERNTLADLAGAARRNGAPRRKRRGRLAASVK
jgi:Rrf2 family protein